MSDILYKTLLFDYYNELLTDKQREMYEMYYLDDLSLKEIGERFDISRQGARENIKKAEEKLINYEEKLLLVDRHKEEIDNNTILKKELIKRNELIKYLENKISKHELEEVKKN